MAKVKHRVGIDGSIDNIFAALTTDIGLAGWWASSAIVSAEIGGEVDLTFDGLAVLRFQYIEIQPQKRVGIKCHQGPGPWQDSEIRFELERTDQQVFVTLTHENPASDDDDFLYFSTKWSCYLLSLKDLIETCKGRPYPYDTKIHVGD